MSVLNHLREFGSRVQSMPGDVRTELRTHLEGVSADDARSMSTRVLARLLADVVAVVDGEDQGVALARSRTSSAWSRSCRSSARCRP